jgi:putative DNA primase/helicase
MHLTRIDHEEEHVSRRHLANAPLEPWPEPEPVDVPLPPVPKLSAVLLPRSVRDFTVDIAERMQSPLEYPAVAVIAGLATVIGRSCVIRPKRYDSWAVVPNVWGISVGNPSTMKTPATAEAIGPLRRLQEEAFSEWKEEHPQGRNRASDEGT